MADAERKHVYVGEIAPVRIRAWLPLDARAQLRSGVQPEGKAFTLHNVSDQPQQTQETKDGKRYLVVTWFGGVSATKAGKYPISLSLDATVAVRDKSTPQPRRRMGGPFDDPFFDNVFDNLNAQMVQKDVTLKSKDEDIEVLPLPTEDKPAGFTGAVASSRWRRGGRTGAFDRTWLDFGGRLDLDFGRLDALNEVFEVFDRRWFGRIGESDVETKREVHEKRRRQHRREDRLDRLDEAAGDLRRHHRRGDHGGRHNEMKQDGYLGRQLDAPL